MSCEKEPKTSKTPNFCPGSFGLPASTISLLSASHLKTSRAFHLQTYIYIYTYVHPLLQHNPVQPTAATWVSTRQKPFDSLLGRTRLLRTKTQIPCNSPAKTLENSTYTTHTCQWTWHDVPRWLVWVCRSNTGGRPTAPPPGHLGKVRKIDQSTPPGARKGSLY